MNPFLGLPKPTPGIDPLDDAYLRPALRPAKPLPFLDACEFAQQHDLLVMNLREDLTDDWATHSRAEIFNIDFP